ncbi:MAG: hypothetical protein QG608_2406 [Actinomycetota bacterium]|nr:hypothetical protein [Actinomycetota bacterium]
MFRNLRIRNTLIFLRERGASRLLQDIPLRLVAPLFHSTRTAPGLSTDRISFPHRTPADPMVTAMPHLSHDFPRSTSSPRSALSTGFGALTFDAVSWTLLGERLPSGFLPAVFQSDWTQAPAAPRAAAAKAAAAILREKGLLNSADQVDHHLRHVLVRFGLPVLRVGVRGWCADRTALSEIAVGPGYGVSLTRLLRIEQVPETGPLLRDSGLGVELALFPPEELLSRVWRIAPDPIQEAEPAPELPAENVVMKWPEGLGMVESLARAHRRAATATGPTASQPPHRARGRRSGRNDSTTRDRPPAFGSAGRNGWEDIPTTLVDIGAGKQASFQVTLTAHAARSLGDPRPAARARSPQRIRIPCGTWHGTWLTAGSRLVALRSQRGSTPVDRNVTVSFPCRSSFDKEHFPGRENSPGRRPRGRGRRPQARPASEEREVRFVNTDGPQLYTDLALGVSGALGRQQLLWAAAAAQTARQQLVQEERSEHDRSGEEGQGDVG